MFFHSFFVELRKLFQFSRLSKRKLKIFTFLSNMTLFKFSLIKQKNSLPSLHLLQTSNQIQAISTNQFYNGQTQSSDHLFLNIR